MKSTPGLVRAQRITPSTVFTRRYLQQALDINSGIDGRIIGFSGNTSARSVDELNGLEELDTRLRQFCTGQQGFS